MWGARPAFGQDGSCADTTALDAPSTFDPYLCQNACALVGTTWECDLSALCAGTRVEAYAVSNYGGTAPSDYSAWGSCGAIGGFCCTHVEQPGSPVYEVELSGADQADILGFTYPPTGAGARVDNLKPARSHALLGVIHGFANPPPQEGAADEYIYGSDTVGNGYSEMLYGDEDDDYIYGNADGDYIDGGSGGDHLFGGPGNDKIIGGSDGDFLSGDDDNDTLCDDGCAGGQILDGGTGVDTIWYYGDAVCNIAPSVVDAQASILDECGDYNFWAWPPAIWHNCEVQLTSKPPVCPI